MNAWNPKPKTSTVRDAVLIALALGGAILLFSQSTTFIAWSAKRQARQACEQSKRSKASCERAVQQHHKTCFAQYTTKEHPQKSRYDLATLDTPSYIQCVLQSPQEHALQRDLKLLTPKQRKLFNSLR